MAMLGAQVVAVALNPPLVPMPLPFPSIVSNIPSISNWRSVAPGYQARVSKLDINLLWMSSTATTSENKNEPAYPLQPLQEAVVALDSERDSG